MCDIFGEHNLYETLGYHFTCGQMTYNGKYEVYVGQLICEMCEGNIMFFTDFAKKYEISEDLVEMMYYYLSERDDLWEYGTSPRGMWPTEKAIRIYDSIKKQMYEVTV